MTNPKTCILPQAFHKYLREVLQDESEMIQGHAAAAFICGAILVIGLVADLLKKRQFERLIALVTDLMGEAEYLADSLKKEKKS
jgi:hypothetical protein